MGLFDEIAGNILSGADGGQAGGIMEAISGLDEGGLTGLVQSFQQNGLGDLVSSWIGSGENLPVSAEQIMQGLGSDTVRNLAEKAGIAPETLSAQLAEHLPGFIDQVTPDGNVPEGGLLEIGMRYLMSRMS